MKKRGSLRKVIVLAASLGALLLAGCSTLGGAAADIGLAGAGGIAGYELSDHKIGGAAAGAAVGYVGSKIAQGAINRETSAAEKRGYDRAMNQAVKQQYWIMQNQQKEQTTAPEPALTPIVIPEQMINGVVYNARVEYVRLER